MSTVDVPTKGILLGLGQSITTLLAVAFVLYLISTLYDVFFGPMSQFPGSFWHKISGLPLAYIQSLGEEAKALTVIHEKYGPIVQIAPKELSIVAGAQAWNDIYGFKKAGQPKPFKDPILYMTNVIQAESINSASDANHSRQRRVLAHAFSDAALREQQPLLKSWAEKMKAKMEEKVQISGTAKVDMVKLYHYTTFDIMGDLTFGEGLDMLEEGQYAPWVQTLIQGIKLDAWMRIAKHFPIGRFLVNTLLDTKTARAKHWEHFNYAKERVDKRLARTPDRPDFWSRILAKEEGHGGMSMGEHYVTASLFMIAGTETTATALCGVTYLLTRHPEAMKKVKDEIRSSIFSFEDMTLEKLAGLKYTNACLQEAMRMYPPLPCSLLRRTPEGGVAICGQWIPGDVSIGVHVFAMQTSALHFKNPLEFHPERWLGDPEYVTDHFGAMEAFSVGPRNCLGKNLAWHEARLLLATLVLHFDVSLAHESNGWIHQRLYTLWEKPPLMVNLTPAVKAPLV